MLPKPGQTRCCNAQRDATLYLQYCQPSLSFPQAAVRLNFKAGGVCCRGRELTRDEKRRSFGIGGSPTSTPSQLSGATACSPSSFRFERPSQRVSSQRFLSLVDIPMWNQVPAPSFLLRCIRTRQGARPTCRTPMLSWHPSHMGYHTSQLHTATTSSSSPTSTEHPSPATSDLRMHSAAAWPCNRH